MKMQHQHFTKKVNVVKGFIFLRKETFYSTFAQKKENG